ncbi:MAG: hypothetical protein DHS20C08_16520 [Rhodomicrobium sp.]|nr:MAG: hypothetical protein DHS20C08_16520 [Rhodomicrobium sp.]
MPLSWRSGGLLLGLVFFLAVLLVKPIGVSTQFVILDGIIWDQINPNVITKTETGYTSNNSYLAKSKGKYAKSAANPINYSFVFVLAMLLGAGASAILRGGNAKEERMIPEIWRTNLGNSTAKRMLASFIGGFIVLYGARLAGGCTSGHMMSGMMQTAISGYIFALGAFAAAIPTAIFLYTRRS